MTEVDTVLMVGPGDGTRNARFDESTHTWTVGGRCARVIVSCGSALPIRLDRADGRRPYLGVVIPGIPNYFLLPGPNVAAQKAYIAECLDYMSRTGSTRIEVRTGAGRKFGTRPRRSSHLRARQWRRAASRIPSAFEVSSLDDGFQDDDGVYDGPATVRVEGQGHHIRARLTGHIDPIDGHYHWQGTLFDIAFRAPPPQDVIVEVGEHEAVARVTERTPPSTCSVVGVGAPPFDLGRLEVRVPLL